MFFCAVFVTLLLPRINSVAYSKDYIDLMQPNSGQELKQYYADGTNFIISLNFFVRKLLTNNEVPIFMLDDDGSTALAISISKDGIFYQTRTKKHSIKLQYVPLKSLNIILKQENGEITLFSDCVLVFKDSIQARDDADNHTQSFSDRSGIYFLEHINLCHARYYPFINQVGACKTSVCQNVDIRKIHDFKSDRKRKAILMISIGTITEELITTPDYVRDMK